MICRANVDMQIVLDKWACRKYLAKYAAKAEKRTEKINEYISNLVKQFDNEQSAVKLYRKIMMKLITGRDICHQEACHFLSGYKLVNLKGIKLVKINLGGRFM